MWGTIVYMLFSHFSCVHLFATLWTVAHQAPLSMGFSRQEYWSRMPFPSPGDLSDPEIKPVLLRSPALAHGFFNTMNHLGSPYSEPSQFSTKTLNILWPLHSHALCQTQDDLRSWTLSVMQRKELIKSVTFGSLEWKILWDLMKWLLNEYHVLGNPKK